MTSTPKEPEPATPATQPPNSIEANPPAPKQSSEKLKRLAIKGSAYSLLSFAGDKVIRLGSNLVLTRLLFPEAFGLSATVTIFTAGMLMLSDIGIAASVVQSPRGEDPEFLDTAWTLQVIRGAGLCLLGLLLAWPVGLLYHEPLLTPLLAVGSLNLLIGGFTSTSLFQLRRRVDVRRTLQNDLTSQLVGLAFMIPAAWYTRSVWALVLGGLVGSTTKMVLSHLLDVGHRNRLRYSRDVARSITTFGRWILFATAATFLARQADRLVLGKLLGMAELGVYTIAATLAEMGTGVSTHLTRQVLFPVLSRVNRSDASRLKSVYYKARLALDAAMLPVAGLVHVLAPLIIEVLYDQRYREAGWMLQILVLGVPLAAVATTAETLLYSTGDTRSGFMRSGARLLWLAIGLPCGFVLAGVYGLVWAAALSDLLPAVMVLYPLHKKGLLRVHRELAGILLFAAGVIAARFITAAIADWG